MSLRKTTLLNLIIPAICFLAFFVWFLKFNCYQLIYQEQSQLFLFSEDYLHSFLAKPGGLCSYLGSFFLQFYRYPVTAAVIVTLLGVIIFILSAKILHHYRINGILWSLVPLMFLAILQSNELYLPGTTIGMSVALFFFSLYISIMRDYYRYITGLLGCSLLYFIAGGFTFLAFILCIIHELFFLKNRSGYIIILAYILMFFLTPVISSRLVYYVRGDEIWSALLPFNLKKSIHPFIYAMLLYFPLLLLFSKVWIMNTKKELNSEWNWKTLAAGIAVAGSITFVLIRYVYDEKKEILLRIDHYVQTGEWNKAVEYSLSYPGSNQLVSYYGNMAMYKTGQMGDKMFHLPQSGFHGLWLEWKRNEVAPFFGGELFYQIGYISEAYRWAFESLVASGENPRSLKRLVITSIITGDTLLARHYVNILKETLFYKKWAQHYQLLLDNPDILSRDREIQEKRHFEMHTDIFADKASNDIGLQQMLKEHPDNRMAFEYYMAWLLLNKDIDNFAANVYRLKDLNYPYIPVHYEEAILVYMNHTGKNIVPAGYNISRETLDHLKGYLKIMNAPGIDRRSVPQSLFRTYGGTYWFYLNFVNSTGQRNVPGTTKN